MGNLIDNQTVNIMKTAISKSVLWCLILLQSLVSIAQEPLQIGRKKLYYASFDTAPLKVRIGGMRGLRSFGKLSRVGGVAFEEVASPGYQLRNKTITIFYNNENRDGRRLGVVVSRDTVYANIYDWQLIPIAKYSNSYNTSLVSLFGENGDEYNYEIQYHPAIQNTLLGLRIWQADALLTDTENYWELPSRNGRTILGRGEVKPTTRPSLSINAINSTMYSGEEYQAWVLTDIEQKITFSISNNSLLFSGSPYYYFWASDYTELNAIARQYDAYVEKITEYVDIYGNVISGKESLYKYYEKLLLDLEKKAEQVEPKIIYKQVLTESVKKRQKDIRKINPAVYDAALNTMRYSAFFRYIKTNNPGSWSRFLNQIRYVSVRPAIKTPNRLPRY